MKKNLNIVLIVIAAAILICSLTACSGMNNMPAVDRGLVTSDFVELGLERINESYKLDMTQAEMQALAEPYEYITAKNILLHAADVLYNSSVRVQKLANINQLIWNDSETKLFDEESGFDMSRDFFKMLSEAGLTSEDVADILYTAIYLTESNYTAIVTRTQTELTAFRDAIKASDYESTEIYNELVANLNDEITQLTDSKAAYDEFMADETVTQDIESSKEAALPILQTFTKVMYTIDSDMFINLTERINAIQEYDNQIEEGETPQTEVEPFSAQELYSYIGGASTSIKNLESAFSDEDAKNFTSALLKFAVLLENNKVTSDSAKILGVVAAMSGEIKYVGNYVAKLADSITTEFIQNFIDIDNKVYAKECGSILLAQVVENLLKDETASTISAELDNFKTKALSSENSMKVKVYYMLALAFIGNYSIFDEENPNQFMDETDCEKIVSILFLEHTGKYLEEYYNEYIEDPDNEYTQVSFRNQAQKLLEKIETITGTTPDMSGYTEFSEAWKDHILKLIDDTELAVAETSIEKLVNSYKAYVSYLFANHLGNVLELADMPMFPETDADKIARVEELQPSLWEFRQAFRAFFGFMVK